LLADQGLAAALGSQARKSPVAVEVDANRVGRFRPEVEAAVYFCVLEAIQNVSKYANATGATIRHEDAARNNGTGCFGSMGPSASNRSRTRSRSASNVFILHTVSRNLGARVAVRSRNRWSMRGENIAGMLALRGHRRSNVGSAWFGSLGGRGG
jgi:hypothetical protein